MSSMIVKIASIAAGMALLANGFIIFPGGRLKGLAKGLTVTISLSLFAAVLITAVRSFSP